MNTRFYAAIKNVYFKKHGRIMPLLNSKKKKTNMYNKLQASENVCV